MNDLLQTMAVAGGPGGPGGQWTCSSEYLEGPEGAGEADTPAANGRGRQRMKELAFSADGIDCAALTLPSNGRARPRPRAPGQYCLRASQPAPVRCNMSNTCHSFCLSVRPDMASTDCMLGATEEAGGERTRTRRAVCLRSGTG